jgi:CheY-like chemotaxis protein
MSDILQPKSARAHVLIVEDSSVFREMQSLLLRQAGYAISAHEHPESALTAAKGRNYDLAVIDYELPGMNGQAFMHELRKLLPQIAVIFISGSLTLELAIQLSSQGVSGIFNKPANPKILLEKINETLSSGGAKDAAGRNSNSQLPAARRGSSNSPPRPPPLPPSPRSTTSPTSPATSSAPRRRFAISATASGKSATSAPSSCSKAKPAAPSNRSPAISPRPPCSAKVRSWCATPRSSTPDTSSRRSRPRCCRPTPAP